MKRNVLALLALLLVSPALAAGNPVTLYDTTGAPLGTSGNALYVQGGTGGGGGGTANAATTSNGSDAQATSATNQNNVVYNYLFNGTTWDRVRGTGGAMNMILSGAIPAGANAIGSVSVSNFPASQPVTNTGTFAVQNTAPTPGNANLATGQVSVAATATLVSAARPGRGSVTVENTGTTAAYCGGSGVTATTGMLLPGVVGANLTIPTAAAVYCITASGTQTVTELETY